MHTVLPSAMTRYLSSLLLGALIALIGCSSFPSDQEVEKVFSKLAAKRVPSDVSVELVSTFRGDGDSESFSQVIVFDAVAKRDVVVNEGWLTGIEFKQAAPKRKGRVELIYRRDPDGRWAVTDDGLTVPPS
jgi:hypothetical protein